MIGENDFLYHLSPRLKGLVTLFLIVLSIGYFTGLAFVQETTSGTPSGVVENYSGNEDDEDAEEMKFRKSGHEMLNIIHTHVLSMSIIFFILGGLVSGSAVPDKIKTILMIEPLFSVLLTFGGIYLIWLGLGWMSYVVMVSGFLMTLSFAMSVIAILYSLYKK